jgi:hypothetical protein
MTDTHEAPRPLEHHDHKSVSLNQLAFNAATIALAVLLAFAFGYGLTPPPLKRVMSTTLNSWRALRESNPSLQRERLPS